MSERRYRDDEIAEIFKRAATATSITPPSPPEHEGFSLEELQQIGSEVGIPADVVATAARSIDHPPTSTGDTLLGLPVAVGESVELGRRLTDNEWDLLVVAARDTFRARGRLRADGEFREWTNGNLMMLLEPTLSGHRLRLQSRHGAARARIMAGIGVTAFAGILTAIGFSLPVAQRAGSFSMATTMLVIGAVLLGIGIFQVAGWARRRREQMQRLVALAMKNGITGILLLALVSGAAVKVSAQAALSGNPILKGWYADPEAHIFAGQYWIYPTYSAPYDQQTFMDAFSSTDLVTWVKHPHVLDTANVSWAHRAIWAPSIVEKDGWYYLFFGANDIQNDQEHGGIGVARSRSPGGPFKDVLGKPLIDAFHNGAQPIDQMVFRDVDGTYYIVYGGWRHCNIAKLNADFTGLVTFADGATFKEITPKGYVEGAYMMIRNGKYYFMWSEGGWTGPNYAVAYAVGDSPFGPFERVGKILQQDSTVATGAGHHSVLHADGSPNWYIVYHRRPLGETDGNHRAVSIDLLKFDEAGRILPVKITREGVAADPLRHH